jgi:hypothetical protein
MGRRSAGVVQLVQGRLPELWLELQVQLLALVLLKAAVLQEMVLVEAEEQEPSALVVLLAA